MLLEGGERLVGSMPWSTCVVMRHLSLLYYHTGLMILTLGHQPLAAELSPDPH